MGVRNAPGPDVDVLTLVERADLPLAADLRVLRAAADGPLQTADSVAGLEDLVVVAELAELVADDETREPGAQHQHPGLGRPARELGPLARRAGHEVPGAHRGHHQRGAADGAELMQESATGENGRGGRQRHGGHSQL